MKTGIEHPIDTEETLAKFRKRKLREFETEVSEVLGTAFRGYVKLCERYGAGNVERETERLLKVLREGIKC